MTILAVETTHSVASVALLRNGIIYDKTIISDKRHEETVMPALDLLLSEAGCSPEDIDLIAVDNGPGSFTGVRIGICHANAMAYALNIPCVGISSLECMAWSNLREEGYTAAILNAGNGNCYGALLDDAGRFVITPSATAADVFLERVHQFSPLSILSDSDTNYLPKASMLAVLAEKRMREGRICDKQASPLYLRPSQAERNYKK